MRIIVHIGLPHCGASALQTVLDAKRKKLAKLGVFYAHSPGKKNHTRLYMAVSDPGHVDPLRHARGFAGAAQQERLQANVAADIAAEIAKEKPETYVLSADQLATLPNRAELERLKALLAPFSDDIRIVAHVDEQSRVLARSYAAQLAEGRTAPLARELALAGVLHWRRAALRDWSEIRPARNCFPEIQAVPHWLDYHLLAARWEEVFGPGSVSLRGYDAAKWHGEALIEEVRDMLWIGDNIGKAPDDLPVEPAVSAATLARWRQMNEVFTRLLDKGRVIPRPLWSRMLAEVAVGGAPIRAGSLAPLSRRFAPDNATLAATYPKIGDALVAPGPADPWTEANPGFGFRASQYAAAFLPRIDQATREARRAARKAE